MCIISEKVWADFGKILRVDRLRVKNADNNDDKFRSPDFEQCLAQGPRGRGQILNTLAKHIQFDIRASSCA